MITLDVLKLECKSFLSKLKNMNTDNIGIDDELIKILYELTLVIDDYYSRNEMFNTVESSRDTVRNENAARTSRIGAKGSQMKCDVCNVYINCTEKDFALHVNGKSHQSKCGIIQNNNGQNGLPSSSGCIPKSTTNTISSPVIKNAESIDREGDASAVFNLPKSSILVDSPKKTIAENSLQPIAITSTITDLGSDNNATNTAAHIKTKIHKPSILIGINGNQIPSNKIAEPLMIEKESEKLCDVYVAGSGFAAHLIGERHQLKVAEKENATPPSMPSDTICDPEWKTNNNSPTVGENEASEQILSADSGANLQHDDENSSEQISNKLQNNLVYLADTSNRADETASKNELNRCDESGDVRIKTILNNTNKMFPKAKVHLYGSRSYQLNDDNSDMNIYLDLDDVYHQKVTRKKMFAKDCFVDRILRNYSDWKNLKYYTRNYLYPVIEAVDKNSAIKCTFSFANGAFVEGSKRLIEYIEVLPMIRDFVEFLKSWQSNCGGFKFSSYQLTILVLWYFQYRNFVPTIRMLQNGSKKIMCGDIQVNFDKPVKLLKPITHELEHYAEDFFDIFGNNYVPERDVICPHFGKLFRRKIDEMDPSIDTDNVKLYNLIENAKDLLWNPPTAYMYVHDIFIHRYCPNITINITQGALKSFQLHCKNTAKSLRLRHQNY